MVHDDQYTLIEEISKSQKSVLYKGTLKDDNRPILIKTFRTIDASPDSIARFKQELSEIRKVNSDGIISLYKTESHSDEFTLILEDFNGISLRDYYEKNQRSLKIFIDISLQLAQILGEIHNHGITYKNLRPSNILADPNNGKVKITDLGISLILTGELGEIYSPNILDNVLPYISPEQTGRMNRRIDYRTDFYSLGVILYEILTGEPPFYADDPLELYHAHIAKMPKSPSELNPNIPQVISNILMKLLSKNPEDRYQSVYGIKSDFEECNRLLNAIGYIEDFDIGSRDLSDKFILSQEVYGRKNEVLTLLSAYSRISQGNIEFMIIEGVEGAGKTTLVNEIRNPIDQLNGYFISGKYDKLQKDIPYSAIIEAFSCLIRLIFSECEESIDYYRMIIREALGVNGKVITDVIPELEMLIGEQEEVAELGTEQSQNRFNIVFQDFFKVFAKEEHPLVIFLDDFQWVDLASLNLLKIIMSDADLKYCLLICAYRSCESGCYDSILPWLHEIKKSSLEVNSLGVPPLAVRDINEMVVDTLKSDPLESNTLSEVVHNKTGGNPFYTKQFLQVIYDDNIFVFSAESGWSWDIDQIQQLQMIDDAVGLMEEKILKLSTRSQEALKHASAIGNSFNLDVLTKVYDRSYDETYTDLYGPSQIGLLVKTKTGYIFAHERIREASYALLSGEEKRRLHYCIGNLLLNRSSKEGSGDLFEIVYHLNLGINLIKCPEEKLELARLNLKASKRARDSGAYDIANQFLNKCIGLLPKDVWNSEYDLALTVHNIGLEISYLNGDLEAAEEYFDQILSEAKTVLDTIDAYEIKINSYTVLNKRREAIDIGIKALSTLGFKLPKKSSMIGILKEIIGIRLNLIGKNREKLLDLPELTDARKLSISRLFSTTCLPAYSEDPKFMIQMSLKFLSFSLINGNSRYVGLAYLVYAIVLCGALRNMEEGFLFGNLALKSLEKYEDSGLKTKIISLYGIMINHWGEDANEDIKYIEKAYESTPETGDILWASYSLFKY
ncbi:MAG: serine/threonine-protein kinase PknK, partial [Halobacteriota archaeon]|nr:serine/threonine-protein kinase PknK [Halobacteriota archaeon]